MTDNEIIKALSRCSDEQSITCDGCPYDGLCNTDTVSLICKDALDLINRQKAEIERLQKLGNEAVSCFNRMETLYKIKCKELETAKSEAMKEFAEKIKEVIIRYVHLHNYAEQARKAEIECADGRKIEMQSVWDALMLQKNDMAEYKEMGELQDNIEIIAKDRLLTEIEKDFRLLIKEMVGDI